jgi:hypothetical protein
VKLNKILRYNFNSNYFRQISTDIENFVTYIVQRTQKYRLSTGWTTGRSRFDPRLRRIEFSSSLCVQTVSGVHPASCTMGTGGTFPELKRGRGVRLTTHPHLIPRSRLSRSYTSSPPSSFMACSGTALVFTHKYQSRNLTVKRNTICKSLVIPVSKLGC